MLDIEDYSFHDDDFDNFFVGGEQHSADYKKAVVTYYLRNNNNIRDTCKIFGCHYQSLARWVADYKGRKTFDRKTRKNSPLKIDNKIERFVIGKIKKTPTVTAWALAKLVKNKYAVDLSDRSINNIFVKNNITRKKVSSLTAKHPHRLSARQREKLDGLVGLGAGGAYFVGYFSIFLNTPKKYGRSFRGERALKMSASASVPSLHLYFMYIIHGGKILEWKCVAGGGGGVGDLLFEFFKDKYAEKYRKDGAGGAAAVILLVLHILMLSLIRRNI